MGNSTIRIFKLTTMSNGKDSISNERQNNDTNRNTVDLQKSHFDCSNSKTQQQNQENIKSPQTTNESITIQTANHIENTTCHQSREKNTSEYQKAKAQTVYRMFMIGEFVNDVPTGDVKLFESTTKSQQQQSNFPLKRLKKHRKNGRKLYFLKIYDKSILQYNEALYGSKKHFNNQPNQYTAVILNQIGVVEFNRQNYKKSLMYFEQSMEIAKKAMNAQQKEFEEWNSWQAVMKNCIQALKANSCNEAADKLERDLFDLIQYQQQPQNQ